MTLAETRTPATETNGKLHELRRDRWGGGTNPENIISGILELLPRIRDMAVIVRLDAPFEERGSYQDYAVLVSAMSPHEALGLFKLGGVLYVDDTTQESVE